MNREDILKLIIFSILAVLIIFQIFSWVYGRGQISGQCETTCYRMTNKSITHTYEDYEDCIKDCKNLRDFSGIYKDLKEIHEFEDKWGVEEC